MNKAPSLFPQYGEIYQVYFHPKRGKEIGKIRPALVISNNEQNEYDSHIIVVPLSTKIKKVRSFEVFIDNTPETGLDEPSKVLIQRVRAIDKKLRLRNYVGTVNEETMLKVKASLKLVLNLE
ncbi:MAG: transcriptional modulator of MazE/toxin, MazF [Mycoplasmataceae bacterium CE_OT135]|nr:MAG: transcriptional modulator of MazE/toxin, MazF [Mycoplasmataceae bacterium CE_OT135]